MDFVTPLMNTLQAQANLEHTQQSTVDLKALAQQRQLNTQLEGIKVQQTLATQQALMRSLQGGDMAQDPTLMPSDSDTPVAAAMKNAKLMQANANQSMQIARDVAKGGGSPADMDRFWDNAQKARHDAVSAQREVLAEQQNLSKQIGGIANAVSDADSFKQAYDRIARLDPQMAQSLPIDRDPMGVPQYSDKSQRAMTALGTSSMTASEQLNRSIQASNSQIKQADLERKYEALSERERLNTATIALKQAGVDLAEQRVKNLQNPKGGGSPREPVVPAATGPQKKSAADAISAAYPNFDDTSGALAADVADRALQLRADAKKSGTSLSLDDARQQALDQLRPYISSKVDGEKKLLGFTISEGKKVSTYSRGKSADATSAPIPLPSDKGALEAGKVYQTGRGPARWNGTAFEAVGG